MSTQLTKLSDYVMAELARIGVKHVFMVPGGAAMHLNDSLGKTPGLEFVCNLHEHASAVSAEAYGKTTGNLGVAMVTAGPGSTNAVTGVTSAWVNSSPCLFISGQVKRADLKQGNPIRQLGLQEVDIVSIVRPITKYAVTITDPATIRFHLEKALHLARTGRPGPVWLDFPLDVQAAMLDIEALERFTPPVAEADGLSAQVTQVIDLLNASERPVVLVGGGIRLGHAETELLELLDILGVPVLSTWVGADLITEDHPLFVGRPGSFAPRGANFAVQNSDFLLAIGARLDLATTGYAQKGFARAARKVMVDVDPAELEKMHGAVDVAIAADAGAFIRETIRQRERVQKSDRTSWTTRCRNWKKRYPVVGPEHTGRQSDTSTYLFVDRLSEMLGEGDVIVEGSSGIHSEIFFLAFRVKAAQRIIADGSLGAMGYGLPATIGTCLAAGRQTVLVEGDGSLMPNIQELETIARLRLPIKIFVVNNHGYSSIRASQQRYFQRLVAADTTSGLTLPDVSRVAAAFGIQSERIDRESELDDVMKRCLAAAGPVICDVNVPREEDRVPRLSSLQRPDGTMVSKPLEDLFPFLERDEFLENMIIPPLEEP